MHVLVTFEYKNEESHVYDSSVWLTREYISMAKHYMVYCRGRSYPLPNLHIFLPDNMRNCLQVIVCCMGIYILTTGYSYFAS